MNIISNKATLEKNAGKSTVETRTYISNAQCSAIIAIAFCSWPLSRHEYRGYSLMLPAITDLGHALVLKTRDVHRRYADLRAVAF